MKDVAFTKIRITTSQNDLYHPLVRINIGIACLAFSLSVRVKRKSTLVRE